MTLKCSTCGEEKPTSEFHKAKTFTRGYHYKCKMCIKAYRKTASNGRYEQEQQIKRLYGMTLAEYDELLQEQGGVCAICGNGETSAVKKWLAVDHDHLTGEVRGLLCHSCNVGLGYFNDDPKRLERAVEYLRFG